MKSFADAAKAALDYKKNWAFINVLDDIGPVDACRNTKNLGLGNRNYRLVEVD